MEKRVFSNPRIKDVVTFIKTSRETGGAYTLVEVELAPGGGNGMHVHYSYDEEFTAINGTLGVDVGKNKLRLQEGHSAIAPRGKFHRFYNPGQESIKFRVKLTPGFEGFENALKIAYGLAEDGLVNKKGIPRNFTHISLLTSMSDTSLPGILSMLGVIMKRVAKKASRNGVDKELISKYC